MKRFTLGAFTGVAAVLGWLAWDLRPRELRHSSRPDLRLVS